MVYVHTILRDVAGLFKVGRLVAYHPLGIFGSATQKIVNTLLETDGNTQPEVLPTPNWEMW